MFGKVCTWGDEHHFVIIGVSGVDRVIILGREEIVPRRSHSGGIQVIGMSRSSGIPLRA